MSFGKTDSALFKEYDKYSKNIVCNLMKNGTKMIFKFDRQKNQPSSNVR